jgi:hypothetical protein
MTRTVAQKLGWKAGMTVRHWACPADLVQLLGLPQSVAEEADILLGFVATGADLSRRLAEMEPHYRRSKRLWFAYPKKSGRIRSDIDRDHGWDVMTASDLLPVTQIAIDVDWSALRFRYRDEIVKLTRKF